MSEATPSVDDLMVAIDQLFLLFSASFVFMMQLGFAFVEAGLLREKNVTNILMKNVYDACLGVFIYWAVGYAFAFGESSWGFIGTTEFFLIGTPSANFAYFFFQFTFAATAATIVSGAVAERADFKGYVVYAVFLTGFVYPIASHWVWSGDGWLYNWGYIDFAGSGAVHAIGGSAALTGCYLLGPRAGRYRRASDTGSWEMVEIPPHSVPFFILGALVLWLGFLSFNGGSELRITPSIDEETGEVIHHGANVAKVYINTMLAGSGGGLTSLFTSYYLTKMWNLVDCVTGILAAMVSVCAGVNLFDAWAAGLVGGIAGIIALFAAAALKHPRMMIDDPVDAIPVHLVGGIWGVLAVGFFARDTDNGSIIFEGKFLQLGIQLAAVLTMAAWTIGLMYPCFAMIKIVGWLRISKFHEKEGLDYIKHGHSAYNHDIHGRRRLSGQSGITDREAIEKSLEKAEKGEKEGENNSEDPPVLARVVSNSGDKKKSSRRKVPVRAKEKEDGKEIHRSSSNVSDAIGDRQMSNLRRPSAVRFNDEELGLSPKKSQSSRSLGSPQLSPRKMNEMDTGRKSREEMMELEFEDALLSPQDDLGEAVANIPM